jgi:hypothetical protein
MGISKIIFNKKFFCFTLALLSLGSFYPFVHSYVLFENRKLSITIFFISLWLIFIILNNIYKIKLPNKTFNIIVFIQVIFILIWSFVLDSISIRSQGVNLLISWFFLLLIINSIDVYYFLKAFIRINIISLVLCVVGIILVVLGWAELYSSHQYNSDRMIFNYLFFFIKREELMGLNIRPAGYYDEPGSFSFIIMLLLLLNRKFFKNLTWECLMLFLTIVTTSLAHIVTSLLFIASYYLNTKKMKNTILLFSLIGIIIFAFKDRLLNSEYGQYINSKTFVRVESILNNEGDLSRGGGFKLGPNIFKNNLLGSSPEFIKTNYPSYVNETIWSPFIYYGAFGVCIYFLLFIHILKLCLKNNTKESWVAFIIVVANLIQRPNYMFPIFIILLYFLFFTENDFNKNTNELPLNLK